MASGWSLFLEPSTMSLVLTAAMVIAVGCHLSNTSKIFVAAASLQQTAQQAKPVTVLVAIALPIIGSIALILLFYFMNILRYLLLVVLGLGAVSSVAFLLQPFTDRLLALLVPPHSALARRQTELGTGLALLPALAVTVAWGVTLAWPLSNALAVCIGAVCIAVTRLPSLRVCAALLGAFFVYDVFWVFLSGRFFGESVMVSVAQGLSPSGDASFPALLTFPTFVSGGGKNLLGMGDIVWFHPSLCSFVYPVLLNDPIFTHKHTHLPRFPRQLLPGLVICYLHRVDVVKLNLSPETATARRVGYFPVAFAMYFVGLLVTFAVLVISQSGQPALLYLGLFFFPLLSLPFFCSPYTCSPLSPFPRLCSACSTQCARRSIAEIWRVLCTLERSFRSTSTTASNSSTDSRFLRMNSLDDSITFFSSFHLSHFFYFCGVCVCVTSSADANRANAAATNSSDDYGGGRGRDSKTPRGTKKAPVRACAVWRERWV